MHNWNRTALRLAGRVCRVLGEAESDTPHRWPAAEQSLCERLARQYQIATARGWSSAADKVLARLREASRQLADALAAWERATAPKTDESMRPMLRAVYRDLVELHGEYPDVSADLRAGTLTIVTEPVTLAGVELGPFEVELEVSASRSLPAYRVVALDPHPACGSDDVTHPHVRGESLCEGDAAAAIRTAWRQGRISDLFTLIERVLHTYNPDSPFVPLDRWHGEPCVDCGDRVDVDAGADCESCREPVCGGCVCCCCDCDRGVCSGCSAECRECDDLFCTACLTDGVCESCIREREAANAPAIA